jgi:glycosyltransferase involved in cell wall biosynthesis
VSDINVMIVLRSDGREKGGGDVNLMRSFKESLAADFAVSELYGVPSPSQLDFIDVVVACNLDRPVEAFLLLKLCKRLDIKFVFYSLHHPHIGVERYLRLGVKGWKGIIARMAFYDPIKYESMLWLLRMVYSLIFRSSFIGYAPVRIAQIELVSSSDAFVVSSLDESVGISRDICPVKDFHIVEHIRDVDNRCLSTVLNRIIIPGRIESRKNQRLILQLSKFFPSYEFIFVGGFTASEPGYKKSFTKELANSKNCKLVSNLSKDAFYDFLATAYIVITASWFEVTSLIELFCLDNGIPLMCSKYSYISGSGAMFQYDPSSLDDAIVNLELLIRDVECGSRSFFNRLSAVTMNDVVGSLL